MKPGPDPLMELCIAIASRISLEGLHIAPGADLSRDPAFQARIFAVGGAALLDIVDPSRRAQFEHQAQYAGSHAFRYASLLGGLYGLGHAWSDDRGEDGGSSADYDVLSGSSTDYSSPAGQARMRDYARRQGVGWAGDHPEILRMGPGAIEALRDAQFRRESFTRLREAGFEGRDAARMAVGISRYAVQHGLDANRIAEQTARGVEVFGGDSPEARATWRDRFTRFFENPDNEEARREMGRALAEIEARGTPQQREHVQALRPLLRLEAETRVELSTAITTHTTEVAGNDDIMADLNGGPVAPTGARADGTLQPEGRRTVAENTTVPPGPRLG